MFHKFKKIHAFLITFLMLLVSENTFAGDSLNKNSNIPHFSLRKSLYLNRLYLALKQYQFYHLEAPETGDFNTHLQNQILLFDQESDHLRKSLPKQTLAKEFLRDILIAKRIDKIYELRSICEKTQLPGTINNNNNLHEKALTLVEAGDMEKAIPVYQEIILRNPDDDQACIILGHIYLMTGEYSSAEIAFQNAIHIQPDNIYEITPLYENMLMQNPNNDDAYANLGYIYLMVGDYLKAKGAFENSLSINPNNERSLMGLSSIKQRER